MSAFEFLFEFSSLVNRSTVVIEVRTVSTDLLIEPSFSYIRNDFRCAHCKLTGTCQF